MKNCKLFKKKIKLNEILKEISFNLYYFSVIQDIKNCELLKNI